MEQTENTAPPTPPAGWDPAAAGAWPVVTTAESPLTESPLTGSALAESPVVGNRSDRFSVTPLLVMAVITGALAVAGCLVDLYSINTDIVPALNQTVTAADLLTNVTVATVIGAVLAIGGAVLSAVGRRIGSGLAGGAGLAIAGLVALVVARVILDFDRTEFAVISAGRPGTIVNTREVGFWLLLVSAAAGCVTFALAVRSASGDPRPRMPAPVAVIGVFGTLAVMAGPLIPQNGATFGQNFNLDTVPPAFLYLRLGSLVLIGVCGLVGFLHGRQWGIGIVIGGICIGLWEWFTTIRSDQGDRPLGIAVANVGSSDLRPHVVTTIGLIAMLGAVAVALVTDAVGARSHSAD